MLLLAVGSYLGIGLLAAAIAVTLFPPCPGYTPPRHIWCLAVVALACFWPMLVLMSLSYLTGWLYERQTMKSRSANLVRAPRFHYRVLPDDARIRN